MKTSIKEQLANAVVRYAKDANGMEHAPAGSPDGGQFVSKQKRIANLKQRQSDERVALYAQPRTPNEIHEQLARKHRAELEAIQAEPDDHDFSDLTYSEIIEALREQHQKKHETQKEKKIQEYSDAKAKLRQSFAEQMKATPRDQRDNVRSEFQKQREELQRSKKESLAKLFQENLASYRSDKTGALTKHKHAPPELSAAAPKNEREVEKIGSKIEKRHEREIAKAENADYGDPNLEKKQDERRRKAMPKYAAAIDAAWKKYTKSKQESQDHMQLIAEQTAAQDASDYDPDLDEELSDLDSDENDENDTLAEEQKEAAIKKLQRRHEREMAIYERWSKHAIAAIPAKPASKPEPVAPMKQPGQQTLFSRPRSRLTTLFYKKIASNQSSFSFASDPGSGNGKKKPKTKDDFRAEFERLHPRGPDGKWIKKDESEKVKKTTIRKPAASKSSPKKPATSKPVTAKPVSAKAKTETLPLFDESGSGEANINSDGTLKAKLREALQRAIATRSNVVSKSPATATAPASSISIIHADPQPPKSQQSQPSPEFMANLAKAEQQIRIMARLKKVNRKADYDDDDFVQDVNLLAAKNHQSFDPARGKFTTWIHNVATNHAISLFRKSKRLKNDSGPMYSIDAPTDGSDDAATRAGNVVDHRGADESHEQSDLATLRTHVDKLPSKIRDVIRERFLNGKSIKDIQQKLGQTRQTVHNMLNDGLQRIREEMAAGGKGSDDYQRDRNEKAWTK